jgi:hypothetical protein
MAGASKWPSKSPATNQPERPGLYDRRDNEVSLDEVERIVI